MKFTKMHGIGNDYVYVNCFEETVKDPAAVAKFVSDRHFGIGSDGLILIRPSEIADCEMDMYNLDGSQGAMCGNGIRCVAKYVYDHGIVDKTSLSIATRSGIKYVDLTIRDGKASMVKVNMGSPILTAKEIPVVAETEQVIDAPITVDGKEYHMTAVSMGNPHAIIYVDDVNSLDLEKIGPSFENHVCFPDRVNTEFVQVIDRHTVKMRVWERGSGETLACGTGACAVTVASILNDKVDGSKPVTVQLLGGGSDREQMLVCEKLKEIQKDFKAYVEDNGVVIAICGGYQLLGNYYKTDQGMIEGLKLVDMSTEQGKGRLIGNIVMQSDLFDMPIVGFENHGGRTTIGNNRSLGKVLSGYGNDGQSGEEGVVYKNVIGTYLHGPLLPKNPQLADLLISRALEKKYGKKIELEKLDDSEEQEANSYIFHRFVKNEG